MAEGSGKAGDEVGEVVHSVFSCFFCLLALEFESFMDFAGNVVMM